MPCCCSDKTGFSDPYAVVRVKYGLSLINSVTMPMRLFLLCWRQAIVRRNTQPRSSSKTWTLCGTLNLTSLSKSAKCLCSSTSLCGTRTLLVVIFWVKLVSPSKTALTATLWVCRMVSRDTTTTQKTNLSGSRWTSAWKRTMSRAISRSSLDLWKNMFEILNSKYPLFHTFPDA